MPIFKDTETFEIPVFASVPLPIAVAGVEWILEAVVVPIVDARLEAAGGALETICACGIRSADGKGGGR